MIVYGGSAEPAVAADTSSMAHRHPYRGFEHVPALEHLQGWLTELIAA
jgi:hypothetical protein